MPSGDSGLRAEVSSLVGRGREIGDVKRLLATARLVTLTGVGGSGKTRLATRVAAELRRAFRDGTCVVDLAAVGDPELIGYAVAEVLGLRGQTTAPVGDLVVAHLRGQRCLIVLDNCEHLLDGCAA